MWRLFDTVCLCLQLCDILIPDNGSSSHSPCLHAEHLLSLKTDDKPFCRGPKNSVINELYFCFQVNNSTMLDNYISSHFRLVEFVQNLRLHSKYNTLDIYSHEIKSNPQENIRKLCNFLEVDPDKDYIEACSKLISSKPSHTRHSVVWTAEQKARITSEMKKYPFLKRFSFYSN